MINKFCTTPKPTDNRNFGHEMPPSRQKRQVSWDLTFPAFLTSPSSRGQKVAKAKSGAVDTKVRRCWAEPPSAWGRRRRGLDSRGVMYRRNSEVRSYRLPLCRSLPLSPSKTCDSVLSPSPFLHPLLPLLPLVIPPYRRLPCLHRESLSFFHSSLPSLPPVESSFILVVTIPTRELPQSSGFFEAHGTWRLANKNRDSFFLHKRLGKEFL